MAIQDTIHDNKEQAQTRHETALKGMTSNSATGREAVTVWQIIATISAMKLEIETGMKMSRRVNVFANVKTIFGWKGNKASILKQLQVYKFENHPIPAFGKCDTCGAMALIEVSEKHDGPVMDFTDGTNVYCHPIYGGCDGGFNAPADVLAGVAAWRKAR
jgi:hypothetical protein